MVHIKLDKTHMIRVAHSELDETHMAHVELDKTYVDDCEPVSAPHLPLAALNPYVLQTEKAVARL